MKLLLETAKQRVARNKGNSTLIVASPTQRTVNNYLALLPQLEPNRSKTTSVQQKSEARYIAEHSVRNAVSHVMTVSVSHYQIGKPDTRLKGIDKATPGAIKLYNMIKAENKGLEIRAILPMFISTTDDTTIFSFEGAVESKANECYIVKKTTIPEPDLPTPKAHLQPKVFGDSEFATQLHATVWVMLHRYI